VGEGLDLRRVVTGAETHEHPTLLEDPVRAGIHLSQGVEGGLGALT
jgi:hypothetical protein